MYRTKQQLIDGLNPEYLFFWGTGGEYGYLSQWSPHSFRSPLGSEVYTTAEHYMMARKAGIFKDEEVYEEILNTPNPKDVKALGRKIKNYDDKVWSVLKFDVVFLGNLKKFKQNKEIKDLLISTGNKILVEASPYDKIWGIGLSKDHPDATNPSKWPGENLLGFVLMEVRTYLIEESVS